MGMDTRKYVEDTVRAKIADATRHYANENEWDIASITSIAMHILDEWLSMAIDAHMRDPERALIRIIEDVYHELFDMIVRKYNEEK